MVRIFARNCVVLCAATLRELGPMTLRIRNRGVVLRQVWIIFVTDVAQKMLQIFDGRNAFLQEFGDVVQRVMLVQALTEERKDG